MPPSLDLNNTFGALLIGVFVSAALFGVTCTQVFFYFQNYESDNILVKSSVVLMLILEILHSAFGIHAIYHYTILNYLNPEGLLRAVWSATMTLGISTAIILVVHVFYIRRVYYISRKNIPLVALISLLAAAHLAFSIVVSVRAFELKFFAAFVEITDVVDSSLSLAVATDVAIAVSLSYYLHTSRSGVESTDTIINKLMMYAINNGILTSVFDILVVIFVTTEKHNLIFLSIFQVVGNLYTNSMMATLNSRRSVYQASRRVAQVSGPGHSVPGMAMNTFRVATTTEVTTTIDGASTVYDGKQTYGSHEGTMEKGSQIV